MAICASNFWTLAIGTSVADGAVDREDLDTILVPGEDSAGVVAVGSKVIGLSPWTISTVSPQVLTQRLQINLGPSPWCRFIDLIPYETDMSCPGRSMEDIFVPNGNSNILT